MRIDPATRRVIVGPRAALAVASLTLAEPNWIGPTLGAGRDVMVKVRSMAPPAAARITQDPDGRFHITFAAPEYGVAPGQAAVVYDGSRVLGGGWIDTTLAAA